MFQKKFAETISAETISAEDNSRLAGARPLGIWNV
jgi:hypothetical protein